MQAKKRKQTQKTARDCLPTYMFILIDISRQFSSKQLQALCICLLQNLPRIFLIHVV